LREQGHEVGLIPAQHVKPYVKTNKSDSIDAEAIADAIARPTMRFVPIKSDGHSCDALIASVNSYLVTRVP